MLFLPRSHSHQSLLGLEAGFPSRFRRNWEKQDPPRILKDPKMHLVPLSNSPRSSLSKLSLSSIQILPQLASIESHELKYRGQESRVKSQDDLLKAPSLTCHDFG